MFSFHGPEPCFLRATGAIKLQETLFRNRKNMESTRHFLSLHKQYFDAVHKNKDPIWKMLFPLRFQSGNNVRVSVHFVT